MATTAPVVALHHADGALWALDQTQLPWREIELELRCADDVIAPSPVGDYVHRHAPGSTLVSMNATGHCPNLSAPDETVAVIKAYL